MQVNSYNNIIVEVLTSPRWRILRYLILFVFAFSISAGFIWFAEEKGLPMTFSEKYGGLFLFISLFFGVSYLNIYILTPRLLLKNKLGAFFSALFGATILIIVFITLFQNLLFEKDLANSFKPDGYIHYFAGLINILSSSLSLFLFSVGVSTLVLFKHWILDMQQSEELETNTLQLELKMLENQINPHFLFNMLNNANIMIKKDPDMASHIIEKLEEMLRYQINDNLREKVHLKEEILFINDFLDLEKTRRDYFTYSVTEEGDINNVEIPPLLFITFVENAIKHSQDSQKESRVNVIFKIFENKLLFICENSLPLKPINKQIGGIGLVNIKRRLDLLFRDKYSLEQTNTNINYIIRLEIKL